MDEKNLIMAIIFFLLIDFNGFYGLFRAYLKLNIKGLQAW